MQLTAAHSDDQIANIQQRTHTIRIRIARLCGSCWVVGSSISVAWSAAGLLLSELAVSVVWLALLGARASYRICSNNRSLQTHQALRGQHNTTPTMTHPLSAAGRCLRRQFGRRGVGK